MNNNSRWIFLGMVVLAAATAWVTKHLVASALGVFQVNDMAIGGSSLVLSSLIGLGVGSGAGIGTYKHPQAYAYANSIATELRKVTWPTREELKENTRIVISAVFLCAAVLGGMDFICSNFTGLIYR